MIKLGSGYNLAALYPEVAKEWHPTKNGDLKPDMVFPKSRLKPWWRCSKCGNEWQAIVRNRANGKGCLKCSKKATLDYNLAVKFPDVAEEWHPILNGELTPDLVTPKWGVKVWWLCRVCGHPWQARVANRTQGTGCPSCAKLKPSKEHNFALKCPDIAKEWHPIRNGDLSPFDVTPKSGQSAWWLCSKGHEWKAEIKSRANGIGCPKCKPSTSRMEILIYCELKSIFPNARWREVVNGRECDVFIPDYNIAVEYDGVYYHRGRNDQDVIKNQDLSRAGITVFRVRQNGLTPLSKRDIILNSQEYDFSVISKLLQKLLDCERIGLNHANKLRRYLTDGNLVNQDKYRRMISYLPGPQPEQSLAYQYPSVAAEWDYERNYPLEPNMYVPGSREKVHWICSAGHRWKAVIYSRTIGKRGCINCLKRVASPEHNLAVRFPEIASEWHPALNGDITPYDVTPRSNKKRFWLCEKCGFEWEATIYHRTKPHGTSCPECCLKRNQRRS